MPTTNSKYPRILCIDADTRTAEWVKSSLTGAAVECEVTAVLSGREAFRRLNSEDFDLCVLEYALPDMTGVQLCSLLRHMGFELPMLFFTPMNRPVDRQYAEEAGATAYLSKPDEIDLFVDTATHLLKRSGRLYGLRPKQVDFAKAA